MRTLLRMVAVSWVLLTAACDQPAVKASDSLVGTASLPSARELSREVIQINSGFGDVGWNFLSYELRPDGTLAITHTDRRADRVIGEETFRLSSDTVQRTKHLLWRLRPVDLQGVAFETRPLGCERRGPHDFGEVAIAFIKEGEKAGVEADQIGVFELPRPDSCQSPQAEEARNLVRRVLNSFPPSKVAAAFRKSS